MIRINGYDFNASIDYTAGGMKANIFTDYELSEMIQIAEDCHSVQIVNDGTVSATFNVNFVGIEKINGGFVIRWNTLPVSQTDYNETKSTVAEHTNEIAENTSDITDNGDACLDLAEWIAELEERVVALEEAVFPVEEKSEEVSDYD